MTRRASASSAIERGVERERDDLRRRDEAGDPLVELDERAELGDRERRLGQVVEVVLGLAGLVDEDHRVRGRAVDQAHRDRAVGRVVDRALALDEDPVAAALALLDEPLDGAVGEVADDPVDGHAPALDHHPGLAGRDHRPPASPARRAAATSSSATDILPIGAVGARRSGSPACRAGAAGRRPSPSGRAGAGSR